jgi:hypothetical protein
VERNRDFGFEESFLLFRCWHTLLVSKLNPFVKY